MTAVVNTAVLTTRALDESGGQVNGGTRRACSLAIRGSSSGPCREPSTLALRLSSEPTAGWASPCGQRIDSAFPASPAGSSQLLAQYRSNNLID